MLASGWLDQVWAPWTGHRAACSIDRACRAAAPGLNIEEVGISRSARLWISSIVASFLSGLYWLLFFLAAEGVTASDYRDGAAPAQWVLALKVAGLMISGPLIFAALTMLWRRLEDAFLERR